MDRQAVSCCVSRHVSCHVCHAAPCFGCCVVFCFGWSLCFCVALEMVLFPRGVVDDFFFDLVLAET